jgi:hypothetical protein
VRVRGRVANRVLKATHVLSSVRTAAVEAAASTGANVASARMAVAALLLKSHYTYALIMSET